MNDLKEGEDDEGEREWRAPRDSGQRHPPSESHSEKHFEQLLGDGGGKRKRRMCVCISCLVQLRRLRFDITLFGATDLAWKTASCDATTILPKQRSCPKSMTGNKKFKTLSTFRADENAAVVPRLRSSMSCRGSR
jgi:hypothetical protein